jgi:hypothetical protein
MYDVRDDLAAFKAERELQTITRGCWAICALASVVIALGIRALLQ